MTRARTIVIISFLVSFAAGATLGLAVGRSARMPRRRSWLSTELGLSQEQREQMRNIWSEAMRSARRDERRQALRTQRDEAVQALLTDEQKARYEEVMQEYSRNLEEFAQERRELFQKAMESTKEILSESQRKKYEKLIESRREPRGRPEREAPRGREGRFGRGAPHQPRAGSGAGPSREDRDAPRAEAQGGRRPKEESLQE